MSARRRILPADGHFLGVGLGAVVYDLAEDKALCSACEDCSFGCDCQCHEDEA